MSLLASSEAFRSAFHHGLERLLDQPEVSLSQLVLVAANALILNDPALLERARQIAAARLRHTGPSEGEDEPILQLILDTPAPLKLIRYRTTPAGYQLQLNLLRARRPHREAMATAKTIHRPFDPAKFNFSHISAETFWHGEWQGHSLSYFYNKYPFAAYHTSVVPEPSQEYEQFLTAAFFNLAWDLQRALSAHQPHLVLAYNSLGAYASINQLHFQMISNAQHLPLIKASDPQNYPIPVTRYTDPKRAWDHINQLQRDGRPFNLLYSSAGINMIERQLQGTYAQPPWNTGLAWYELSGGIIVTDQAAFTQLQDAEIEATLRLAVPD